MLTGNTSSAMRRMHGARDGLSGFICHILELIARVVFFSIALS